MTSDEVNAMLAQQLNAIVGVNRRQGGPQLTPVWFHWDGEVFSFSTTRDRAKFGLIERDPRISLIVDDLAAHRYVVAYGRAEIVDKDRARVAELTRPIVEKYGGANAEAMLQSLAQDPNRVVVLLRPEKLIAR